ncbi:MAG TPA: helix-turn-helix domain-containing protein [Bryobacteraceae bacterium]|nr:helix-turn-helix domain-containing protein [Bryobacteraceae bacterium]
MRKRPATPKHSVLGERLIAAGKEILAHVRGEIQLDGRTLEVPNPKQIRERLGLSQLQFAHRFHFNLRTLQEWEQGRAVPDSAVRAYLTVIDRNSIAVTAALDPPPLSRACPEPRL